MPFVGNYFPNQSIQNALSQTRLCIDRASGPVVIVGGEGSGKSLLLQILREEYDAIYSAVLLDCARLARREDLFQNILFELDQEYRNMSEGELRLSLMDFLRPGEQCPNGMLLLVDEAESLPQELLDEIRRITNLVRNGEPRVRLVLAGNQKLEENLAEWKLGSFSSRIAARCYLQPMTRAETREYVAAHIQRVGGDWENIFTEDSLKEIHALSDGCPRLVNQICEHSLLLGASEGVKQFDSEFVKRAWSSLQNLPSSPSVGALPQSTPAVGEPVAAVEFNKTDQDENWTVIEFGELVDEPVIKTSNSIGSQHTSSDSSETAKNATVEHSAAEAWTAEPADNQDSIDVDAEQNRTESVFENELAESRAEDEVVSELAGQDSENETAEEATVDHDELTASWHGVDDEEQVQRTFEDLNSGTESNSSIKEEDATAPAPRSSVAEPSYIESNADWMSEADEDLAEQGYSQVDTATSYPNPFDEEFESTEAVVDRFMPVFVEQNVASLTVTKSDLEAINPEAEECENHGTSGEAGPGNAIAPVVLNHEEEDANSNTDGQFGGASLDQEHDQETRLGEAASSKHEESEASYWPSAELDQSEGTEQHWDVRSESGQSFGQTTELTNQWAEETNTESSGVAGISGTDQFEAPVQRETPLTVRANVETVSQSELQDVLESLQQSGNENDVRGSLENLIGQLPSGSEAVQDEFDEGLVSGQSSEVAATGELDTQVDQAAGGATDLPPQVNPASEGGDDSFGPGTIVDDAFIERRAGEVLRSLENHGLGDGDAQSNDLPHSVGPEVTHIALEPFDDGPSDADFGSSEGLLDDPNAFAGPTPSVNEGDMRGQLDDLFGSPSNSDGSEEEAAFDSSSVHSEENDSDSIASIASQLNSVFGNESESTEGTEGQLGQASGSSSDDYEEEILSEIQALNQSQSVNGEANSVDETSIPLEYPLGTSDSDGTPTDDRDMLIVSRTEQRHKPESPEPEVDSTPPSTGQAKRMDYQALFDQLRNITDEST